MKKKTLLAILMIILTAGVAGAQVCVWVDSEQLGSVMVGSPEGRYTL